MPRRIYEPDAITTDIALDAIALIEGGVTCPADMGIPPIKAYRAFCSLHGGFEMDVWGSEIPTHVECPEHRHGMGLTHWLPLSLNSEEEL